VYTQRWYMSYWFAACTVEKKNPDDGQRNCLKTYSFIPKNKFEKLVHLDGFIITSVMQETVRDGPAVRFRRKKYYKTVLLDQFEMMDTSGYKP